MVKKSIVVLLLGFCALVALTYIRGHNGSTASGLSAPALAGKIAYARAGALWMYANGKQQQLTAGPKDKLDKRDAEPAFSPDGTELVYVRFDEGFSDLYKLSVSSPADTQALTDNRPNAETGSADYAATALWTMQPAWSPNGERIAYTSDVRTEYPGLFSMNTNGESINKLEYLDHSQQAVEHPTYSPDGTKIAVANYLTNNGTGQIWSLTPETGKWTELTDSKDGAYDPAWSPDGEWIAFTMREGTANNIYIIPTNAEKWTDKYPTPIKLTTDGASRDPAWSPDGAHLAYVSLKDASFDLHVADFKIDDSGTPSLQNASQLTSGAGLDATSGLSWGK